MTVVSKQVAEPTEETPPKFPEGPKTEEPSSPQPESSQLDIELEEPDFSAITASVESDEEELPPPVEPVAEAEEIPAEETPPEAPPVEEPVSEGEPEPEVEEEEPPKVAAEVEETPPVVEEEPSPEPIKVPTMEELEGMYLKHREETLPKLEEIFQLSDEEATALDEQPSKIIPKLAGQMMYDTMLSTYNAVLAALPTVIGTVLKASNSADVAEAQFFTAWPDLNTKKSAPAISAAVQAYRAANPRAKLDDIIQGAGVMAMINLGLDPMKKKEEVVATPKKKVVPAKPAAPRGAPPAPPVAPGDKPVNEFDELTTLFMEDN